MVTVIQSSSGRLQQTRMIFMGEAALADGFRLIGFETWPDPTVEQVEGVIMDLVDGRHNAFLVIDQRLAQAGIPSVKRLRSEGGRIVITAVPPLNSPDDFQSEINDRIQSLLDASQLTNQEAS